MRFSKNLIVSITTLFFIGSLGSRLLARERKTLDFDELHTNQLYFPEGFLYGCAIAEQQNSGAENCPKSNWSNWEATSFPDGRPHIKDGQRSGKACDHWNLYEVDIKLMQELGLNSFRLSLAWDRIEPEQGVFSEDALQHYSDEVDALLKAGIKPMITLHQFAHPMWFENLGAFEKEENIQHFVRYAKKIFEKLGDRVHLWCTINEPTIYMFQGYLPFNRVFPPAKENDLLDSYKLATKVLKHLLMAHTEVYLTLKGMDHGHEAKIGLVHQYLKFNAQHWYDPIERIPGKLLNYLMIDSVIQFLKTGTFDYGWGPLFSETYHAPIDKRSKVPAAQQISDFVGLNYYSRVLLKFELENLLKGEINKVLDSVPDPGETMTDMPYAIYPEGIYHALFRMATIGLPIYVTETGAPDHNNTNDERRQRWITEYLKAISLAREDGVDVNGIFYWTLTDNFEWSYGYLEKFGLFAVDLETQERTIKDGGKLYAKIVHGARQGKYSNHTKDYIPKLGFLVA